MSKDVNSYSSSILSPKSAIMDSSDLAVSVSRDPTPRLVAGTGRIMPSDFTSIPYFPGLSVSKEESTLSNSPKVPPPKPPSRATSDKELDNISGLLFPSSVSDRDIISGLWSPGSIKASEVMDFSCHFGLYRYTILKSHVSGCIIIIESAQ